MANPGSGNGGGGGNGGWLLGLALGVVAAFLGAKALDEVLTPKSPCPRCQTSVKRYSNRCANCGVALRWGDTS